MSKLCHCPHCKCVISDKILKIAMLCPNCHAPLEIKVMGSSASRGRIAYIFMAFLIMLVVQLMLELFGEEKKLQIFIFVSLIILIASTFFDKKTKVTLVINSSAIQLMIGNSREDVRPYLRFMDKKVGALDFLIQEPIMLKKSNLSGLLSPLLKIHNERIGGLSIEEQHEAILRINPHLNLMQLVSEEVEKIEAKIDKLKSFMDEKS